MGRRRENTADYTAKYYRSMTAQTLTQTAGRHVLAPNDTEGKSVTTTATQTQAVTIYTLPACVQCDATKRALDRKGIPYIAIDLSQDESALVMVRGLGYQSAPVVIAGDAHWAGFRPDRIGALS